MYRRRVISNQTDISSKFPGNEGIRNIGIKKNNN